MNSSSNILTTRTKLIDDAKRTVPEFRSMLDGTVAICRQEGVAGLYRGLFATVGVLLRAPRIAAKVGATDVLRPIQTMKQGANSAVRFSSYSGLKSWLEGLHPQTALSSVETFAVGGAAGLITVCQFLAPKALRFTYCA
jgi:solute carrier family 25 citrate transporter 1